MRALYGAAGPSDAQQTREYAPPEALLGRHAMANIITYITF